MGRFIQAKATIDGEERLAVMAEGALPHYPQFTAVDPDDVRAHPWDFDEPDEDAVPDLGPAAEPSVETVELPADTDDPPAGNASAAEWRAHAATHGVDNADTYSRDALRDHFLNDQPLPSEES